MWYWIGLIGSFYLFFRATAPKKRWEPPVEEDLPRADLPPQASPEMRGDDLHEVSDPFGRGRYALVYRRPESEATPPTPPGDGRDGEDGHVPGEDGTLSDDEMDNLSEYDDGGESEGG